MPTQSGGMDVVMKNYDDAYCRNCDDVSCSSVSAQYMDVSLPVQIKPYAVLGEVQTTCVCEPVVTVNHRMRGDCGCDCEVVITQSICIKIPVKYGTNALAGDTVTNCERQNHNYR